MPLDKVFMFPESYNELRKEMINNWPELWRKVQWPMAFDAHLFVELMNRELDIRLALIPGSKESEVDGWCSRYLTELRKRRGHPNP